MFDLSRRDFFLGALVLAGVAPSLAAAGESAANILKAIDQIPLPSAGFRMTNRIVEYHGGDARNQITILVYSKEDPANAIWRDIVQFKDPPRDAGKTILNDGSAMWFYDPASKASMRISPQDRLIGQASNGDVLTTNFSRDYIATLIGEETVSDADRKPRDCWQLMLTPATSQAIYGKIAYWVEKGTYYPVKGRFYADSQRLLKVTFYRKMEMQLGAMRPTEAILIDGLDSKLVTKMNFFDYAAENIPEAWFQRTYLPRIGVQ